MLKILVPTAIVGAFATMAVPAAALGMVIKPCALTDISPNAVSCSGFYQGNLLSGNAGRLADQKAALALIGFDFDTSTWGSLLNDATGDGNANFGVPLAGLTWIGIHFGAGADGPVQGFQGGGTAFYKLNLTSVTNSIDVNWGAGSTAVLYSTGVIPEPATWAMLIAGFGMVGFALRRRPVGVRNVTA